MIITIEVLLEICPLPPKSRLQLYLKYFFLNAETDTAEWLSSSKFVCILIIECS